jgi:hypothetical protein
VLIGHKLTFLPNNQHRLGRRVLSQRCRLLPSSHPQGDTTATDLQAEQAIHAIPVSYFQPTRVVPRLLSDFTFQVFAIESSGVESWSDRHPGGCSVGWYTVSRPPCVQETQVNPSIPPTSAVWDEDPHRSDMGFSGFRHRIISIQDRAELTFPCYPPQFDTWNDELVGTRSRPCGGSSDYLSSSASWQPRLHPPHPPASPSLQPSRAGPCQIHRPRQLLSPARQAAINRESQVGRVAMGSLTQMWRWSQTTPRQQPLMSTPSKALRVE